MAGPARTREKRWRRLLLDLDVAPLWYHIETVEKKRPHLSLSSIKVTFASAATLRITSTARNAVLALGLSVDDVVTIVQGITHAHFYKSMTSDSDSRIWQDVYHVPHGNLVLYVKFTTDPQGLFLLISFKEK